MKFDQAKYEMSFKGKMDPIDVQNASTTISCLKEVFNSHHIGLQFPPIALENLILEYSGTFLTFLCFFQDIH